MTTAATERTPARTARKEAKAGKQASLAAEVSGRKIFTAANADRHELYQLSVQNVEAEIDFVDEAFEELKGRKATKLREDFCGTGNTSCEWVRRRETNTAVGLDIDGPTLEWGQVHNVAPLTAEQQARVTLHNRDVMTPGDATGADIVLAMNFSYWLFKQRADLIAYFRAVHETLGDDGVFFLDHYGGSESMEETTDKRPIEGCEEHGPFTYIWDQHEFNPITGEMECRIHFKFADKTRMKDAFVYHWRLWGLAEIQDCLTEAGFSKVTVFWEGDELDEDGDETGEGNGEFTATEEGTADPAFVCYIGAEK
ncbi:MAG: hypothetical protein DHS20C14_18470 [Phycisphaeraceae bacterium]|nr:MAG: hypothetical protein DHS20C14_18470 [Phycisphaeraceae bacterium]